VLLICIIVCLTWKTASRFEFFPTAGICAAIRRVYGFPALLAAVTERRRKVLQTEKKPRPNTSAKTLRRSYTFAKSTLDRLDELAEARGVKDGDIIRDAIQLYDHIFTAQLEAMKKHQRLAVLLDRGEGSPVAELMVPQLSRELSAV
jgi:hypothetical protein